MRQVLRFAPLVLLAAALVFGGMLRFSDMDATRLYGDEAEYALVAQDIAQDPLHPSYTLNGARQTLFVSQPPLVLYTIAAFGASEAAAKGVVAAFGVLGLLAVFLLGREAYGPWTGAVAAFLLAVAPMHVQVSRLVFLDVPLATMAILAAWLSLRWLRTRSRLDAALAGAATAGAVLAKLPGILVPAALVLAFGLHALRERLHHGSWEAARRAEGPSAARAFGTREGLLSAAWGVGVLVAIGVVYVLFLVAAGHMEAWFDKMAWNAQRVASGEGSSTYFPWTVYIEGPESIPARLGAGLWYLALAGLVYAVAAWAGPARLRRGAPPAPGDAVVLSVTLVVFAFFAASDRKVWFYVLPVVPGLVLLGARAAVDLVRGVFRAVPARDGWVRAARPVAPALVVALFWTQAAVPAVEQASITATPTGYEWGLDLDRACEWIVENRDGDEAAISGLLARYSIRYYCPDLRVFDRFRSPDVLTSLIAQRELRYLVPDPYFLEPSDTATFKFLTDSFPHERVATFGQVQVVEFRPTNLTVDLRFPKTEFARGEAVPLTVEVGNPTNAPARDLTGQRANVSVHAYTPEGHPFRMYDELVPLAGDWRLSPGESRALDWTWTGRSYWSEGSDREGVFHFEVRLGGELYVSEPVRIG